MKSKKKKRPVVRRKDAILARRIGFALTISFILLYAPYCFFYWEIPDRWEWVYQGIVLALEAVFIVANRKSTFEAGYTLAQCMHFYQKCLKMCPEICEINQRDLNEYEMSIVCSIARQYDYTQGLTEKGLCTMLKRAQNPEQNKKRKSTKPVISR